jgi:hypothetical protein
MHGNNYMIINILSAPRVVNVQFTQKINSWKQGYETWVGYLHERCSQQCFKCQQDENVLRNNLNTQQDGDTPNK